MKFNFNFGDFQQASLFGGAEEVAANLVAAEEKKEAKKAEKSTGKKKATKKALKVECPVNVYTPYGTYVAGAAEGFQGTVELESIVDWLITMGFEVLKSQQADLQLEGGNLYMVFDAANAGKNRTVIQWGEDASATLTVGDGMFNAYYAKAEFEAEEVTLLDVVEKFATEYPQYAGCVLTYDPLTNVAVVLGEDVPVVAEKEGGKAKTLKVQGETYDELEGVSLKELHEEFLQHHPEYAPVSTKLGYVFREGEYSPVVLGKCSGNKERFSVKGNTAKAEEQEAKYNAPVSVRTIFGSFELGAEGEQYTEQEIKDYLKANYTEFSSKKFSLDYVEGANCFQAIVYSSQKGAANNKGADLPVGSFFLEDGELTSFSLREGLKVPSEILEEILEFFRRDMKLEAMVQVWHHTEKGFFLVFPEIDVVHKAYIKCTMDNKEIRSLIMDDKATLVVTVHSHNDFTAVFSAIDNADEQGPGLFCVLGNLNQDIPSISVRAAYNGSFSYMKYVDLFQTERALIQFGV